MSVLKWIQSHNRSPGNCNFIGIFNMFFNKKVQQKKEKEFELRSSKDVMGDL